MSGELAVHIIRKVGRTGTVTSYQGPTKGLGSIIIPRD